MWRSDHWLARPERSYGNEVKRGYVEQLDRAVRNTYRVLLTRGHARGRGVLHNEETQALLESLVPTLT